MTSQFSLVQWIPSYSSAAFTRPMSSAGWRNTGWLSLCASRRASRPLLRKSPRRLLRGWREEIYSAWCWWLRVSLRRRSLSAGTLTLRMTRRFLRKGTKAGSYPVFCAILFIFEFPLSLGIFSFISDRFYDTGSPERRVTRTSWKRFRPSCGRSHPVWHFFLTLRKRALLICLRTRPLIPRYNQFTDNDPVSWFLIIVDVTPSQNLCIPKEFIDFLSLFWSPCFLHAVAFWVVGGGGRSTFTRPVFGVTWFSLFTSIPGFLKSCILRTGASRVGREWRSTDS